MLFSFCGFPFHAPMGSTSIPLLTLKIIVQPPPELVMSQ
jgi:hypothetical protein